MALLHRQGEGTLLHGTLLCSCHPTLMARLLIFAHKKGFLQNVFGTISKLEFQFKSNRERL